MKAMHIALQKYIAEDRLNSLRQVEPLLPLPRLINGCPAVIHAGDRLLIRKGHIGVTRQWLSLFNMYRVFSMTSRLNIKTITQPFKGDESYLLDLLLFTRSSGRLRFFARIRDKRLDSIKMNLIPVLFHFSKSGSPSSRSS